MNVEITQHPTSPAHKIAVVTTGRGLVYACTYAPMDEELTVEVIKRDWRNSRRSFRPFDTSRGVYLAPERGRE